MAAAAIHVLHSRAQASPPVIGQTPVSNETGSTVYAPLARATDSVIVSALTSDGFEVRRGTSAGAPTLQAKLVLWNGEPSVGLQVVGRDGLVRWSGTTRGGAAAIPREIDRYIDEYAAKAGVARRRSGP